MTQSLKQAGSFRVGRNHAARTPKVRFAGIAFTAAVELFIVYALLTALNVVPAPTIPHDLRIVNVPPEVKVDVPPSPPQIDTTPPPLEKTVTQEVVVVLTEPQHNVITVPPTMPDRVVTVEPPVITLSPARALLATHTTPEYPPLSRRLNEQGTLRLKLTITAQGTVGDAMVVNSSGFARLDQAAVEWVKSHWRYQPAMQGTKPVASMADAVVTFTLK